MSIGAPSPRLENPARAVSPSSPLQPTRLRWVATGLLALGVAAAALKALLSIPMDVPDTSSPPAATAVGSANDWTSVGQTFVPRDNGLNRVSLVLAALAPTDDADIQFHIKEDPHGQPLRTVRRKVSELPAGDPMEFRPGSLTERWYSFEFEPIPDSAGRKLYFSVEGKGVPRENTVRVLMFYHNKYPLGTAYLSESSVDAHLLFRAHSRGQLGDLLRVVAENLTARRPGVLGNSLFYLALGLLYVLLVGALLVAAPRVLRTPGR